MTTPDPAAELREAARRLRELATAAKELTEDGNGRWFPWGVVQDTEWVKWPEPRPVPVPFAFDGSTEMADGRYEPTGQAFVSHARYAHDQEEDWHEAEFIGGRMPEPVARFIASVHPLVALALADWLEATAIGYETLAASIFGAEGASFVAGFEGGDLDPAIRTARAYLGTREK